MKRSIVAFSESSDAQTALSECIAQINKEFAEPKILIYFSHPDDFIYYTEEIKKIFPSSTTIGAMNFSSFSSQGNSKTGLSILAIFSGIEVSSGLIFEISRHPRNYVTHIRKALDEISSYENTICLEFMSAGSKGEELVMDTFNQEFRDKGIRVVGGTAYESPDGKTSFVALDGVVYTNTCVFALIHNMNGKICDYRENIYKATSHIFMATDVDCENRIVYEYNDEPAAEAISKALGISKSELKSPLNMIKHPMGRLINNRLFITAVDKINDDDSISYFSRIYNCTKMALLDVDDFETVWQRTKRNVLKEIPKPSFSLAINCSLRTELFNRTGEFENFTSHLKEMLGTYIGFSSHGEQMDYIHLNQTLVLLVFE